MALSVAAPSTAEARPGARIKPPSRAQLKARAKGPRLLRRLTLPIRRLRHEQRMKRRFFKKLAKAPKAAKQHYKQEKAKRKVGALRMLRAGQVAATATTGYATAAYTTMTARAWGEPLFMLVSPWAVGVSGASAGATTLGAFSVSKTNKALSNRLKAARISTVQKFKLRTGSSH